MFNENGKGNLNKQINNKKNNSYSKVHPVLFVIGILFSFLFFSGAINFAQSLIDRENPLPHLILAVLSLGICIFIFGKERAINAFLFISQSKFGIIFAVGFVLWIFMLVPNSINSSVVVTISCILGFILWIVVNVLISKIRNSKSEDDKKERK